MGLIEFAWGLPAVTWWPWPPAARCHHRKRRRLQRRLDKPSMGLVGNPVDSVEKSGLDSSIPETKEGLLFSACFERVKKRPHEK